MWRSRLASVPFDRGLFSVHPGLGNFGSATYEIHETTPMAMIAPRRLLRPTKIKSDSVACLLCHWRAFSTSYRRLAEKEAPQMPAASPTPTPSGPLADAPRGYGKAVTDFTPKPLSRPIGLIAPPKAGENTGVDKRTLKQRRDDFVDYEKHLKRRKEL